MSMTKYMHPRNIYRTPPSFKELAILYPEFRKHVKQDISGKVILDFKNNEALRALTCTLLKKDFDLDLEIPLNKLIPTIPLRLNYVLWVEDLIGISGKTENIKGIDIGTGASCVYALIAAKKMKWSLIASEMESDNFAYAQKNVERNNLQQLIEVKQVSGDTILKEAIGDLDLFDFCMCNPPFFSSNQETVFEFKSRKVTRPRPKNAFCAAEPEVVAKGGEVDFISKMISESKLLQQKIRIYTTMIGHKSSLAPLKKQLREAEVVSFKQTEFCQGNTTRWGLAWTFYDIDLRRVPEQTLAVSRKQKPTKPVQYTLTPEWTDVEIVSKNLLEILTSLKIEFKKVKQTKNIIAYNIVAHANTWSHQRRKKREQLRASNNSDSSDTSDKVEKQAANNFIMEYESHASDNGDLLNSPQRSPNVEAATDLISEMQVRSPGSVGKRDWEDDDGYYNNKRLKLNNGKSANSNFLIESTVLIRKENEVINVEMILISSTIGKEAMHQILQYIKNNLKI